MEDEIRYGDMAKLLETVTHLQAENEKLKKDLGEAVKPNQIPQEIIERVRGLRIHCACGHGSSCDYLDYEFKIKNQAIDEVLKVLCPNGQDKLEGK